MNSSLSLGLLPIVRILLGTFRFHSIFLLYLGPETILPLATFIATILGFFLIFWSFIVKQVKRIGSAFRNVFSGKRKKKVQLGENDRFPIDPDDRQIGDG